MFISSTRFELNSWRKYFSFFMLTWKVVRQVKQSGGLVRMRIRPISLRTITVWKTEQAMLDFRNTGHHLQAMRQSKAFGSIHSIVWESDNIPDWSEAITKLDGK